MSGSGQTAFPARRPITVNGTLIAHAEIAREAQHHAATAPGEAWQAAARALALRELLKQEAARLEIVAAPLTDPEGRVETPDEAAMRVLVEREVRMPRPTDEECRRYYENNLARFRSAGMWEASHILIPAAPDDTSARLAAHARAQAICEHLIERPDDFADLASEFSACPSAKAGGALGQLSGGDTVAEFEAALTGLQPGEITRHPVETRFGYHVIRLGRRLEPRQLPFELVAEWIRDYLAERVRRRALQQYVAVLAGRADLCGVEFARPETLM